MENSWCSDPRWQGTRRSFLAEQVVGLRASLPIEYSLAQHGAKRLWKSLQTENFVCGLGALTGAQAVQMVKAGLRSIYISGWQVAADANLSAQTYPDQSLYPVNSVPFLVKRINNALMRADQVHGIQNKDGFDWYVPLIADAEAGFGGPIHAFELMKAMIEAGAAAVHLEDQLASEKKCGHLGGKVLVPISQFIRTLTAMRLGADVLGVPTIIIARTDALSATLLTSDIDDRDRRFLTGERTAEGYFRIKGGVEAAIVRGQSFAPYADLLWMETSTPELGEAREFAAAIRKQFPGKLLAYNCSPSFNWQKHLDSKTIEKFRENLADMGYKYQFITLAGWHSLNLNTFDLAKAYCKEGMVAYVRLQQAEFERESQGYTATRHQQEVGTGYMDRVLMTITGGEASTAALSQSTEAAQFQPA